MEDIASQKSETYTSANKNMIQEAIQDINDNIKMRSLQNAIMLCNRYSEMKVDDLTDDYLTYKNVRKDRINKKYKFDNRMEGWYIYCDRLYFKFLDTLNSRIETHYLIDTIFISLNRDNKPIIKALFRDSDS